MLWAVVQFTRIGLNMRAVGLNERGAILSAPRTKLTKVLAYVLSGAFGATAGIVLTAQQGTASASGLGIGLLLPWWVEWPSPAESATPWQSLRGP